MITFQNVSKSLGSSTSRVNVLEGVTINLSVSDKVAIIGKPGSGISTFLKLLGGLDHPDNGRVRASANLSWIVNQLRFEKNMTLRQNVRFLGRLTGASDLDDLEERVRAIYDIGPKYNHPASALKGQERGCLSFAVSMAIDFDAYLFDGLPVRGEMAQQNDFDSVLAHRCRDRGLFITTNKPAQVATFCDRAVILHDGQVRWYDDFSDAASDFAEIEAGNDQAI